MTSHIVRSKLITGVGNASAVVGLGVCLIRLGLNIVITTVSLIMGAAMGQRRSEKPTVIVLGLDNSGKTAVIDCLRKLSSLKESTNVSNIAFNFYRIRVSSMEMTLCDAPGM